MDKNEYLENETQRIDNKFQELGGIIEQHVEDGHIRHQTLVFFDDSYDLFENFQRFVASGDGVGTVISQLKERDFTGNEELRDELTNLQVSLYALDEELTPV